MIRASKLQSEEPFLHAVDANEYFCPVCGIELAKSNFETPTRHYYCPYCSTQQRPTLVKAS